VALAGPRPQCLLQLPHLLSAGRQQRFQGGCVRQRECQGLRASGSGNAGGAWEARGQRSELQALNHHVPKQPWPAQGCSAAHARKHVAASRFSYSAALRSSFAGCRCRRRGAEGHSSGLTHRHPACHLFLFEDQEHHSENHLRAAFCSSRSLKRACLLCRLRRQRSLHSRAAWGQVALSWCKGTPGGREDPPLETPGCCCRDGLGLLASPTEEQPLSWQALRSFLK
jgi:hypothetical protein